MADSGALDRRSTPPTEAEDCLLRVAQKLGYQADSLDDFDALGVIADQAELLVAERDRLAGRVARLESMGAVFAVAEPLTNALERAKEALYDARCGLDRGLAHARKVTKDYSPKPTALAAVEMDTYLGNARKAWRDVNAVLAGDLDA